MTSGMTDEKLETIATELAKISAIMDEVSISIRYLYEMKIEEREREQQRNPMMGRRQLTTRPPYPAKNRMDYTDFPDVRMRAKPRDLSTDHND